MALWGDTLSVMLGCPGVAPGRLLGSHTSSCPPPPLQTEPWESLGFTPSLATRGLNDPKSDWRSLWMFPAVCLHQEQERKRHKRENSPHASSRGLVVHHRVEYFTAVNICVAEDSSVQRSAPAVMRRKSRQNLKGAFSN